MDFLNELVNAAKTGLIDKSWKSKNNLQPPFVLNDFKKGQKVLTYVTNRLELCDEFLFSAAFLTNGGVAVLQNSLKEFSREGKKGKIFVSDYQYFTDPQALKKIFKFESVETRLFRGQDFHGKGYLFRIGEQYDLLIGSSNLTDRALCKNEELNIHLTLSADSKILKDFLDIFKNSFRRAELIPQVIEDYEKNTPKENGNLNYPIVHRNKNNTRISTRIKFNLRL